MSLTLHPLFDRADFPSPDDLDRNGPASAPDRTNEPPVTYCTSEQMDLLRQVFAEFDRAQRRTQPLAVIPEGHR